MNPNSIQLADAHFQDGTSKLSKMDPNSTNQPADKDEDEYIPEPYDFQDVDEFRVWVMEDDWEEVINRYEEHVFFHTIRIKGRGTALHVAVSNANEDSVKRLVKAIVEHGDLSGLTKTTEKRGDTPLHLAAYRGFTSMCKYIIGKDDERKDLITERNEKGETPLFLAVLARHKETFLYLHRFFPHDITIAINDYDDNILHVAIHREMFGMANIIFDLYPIFISMADKEGFFPLAILATRTSAFKSGIQLSWWEKILYYCVSVKVWDAKTRIELYDKGLMFEDVEDKEKGDQSEISIPLDNVDELEKAGKVRHTLARLDFTSRAKILCYNIQMFVFTKWHLMFPSARKRWHTHSLLDLRAIKSVKKNHIYGGQLLEAFMKIPYTSYMVCGEEPFDKEEMKEKVEFFAEIERRKLEGKDSKNKSKKEGEGNQEMEDSAKNVEKDTTFLAKSGAVEIKEELNIKVKASDKKGLLLVEMKELQAKKSGTNDTAYLLAAKHGITEMMKVLESKLKSVIHETNSEDENALLMAVKNRQPQVVEGLWERLSMETFQSINQQVDVNENTILHLAAYTTKHNENTAWSIAGAAMQMMWDIKWYKYIKRLVPDHYHHRSNTDKKTPSEIFKEEHKEILDQSIVWLKETSESCSVVAALVAGVSFATSGSVPGGNDESGKPTFQGQPAFELFSISSLIGLYFSATALIMFLAILTSRKQVEDFNRNLPMKLLFGLSSLFVAIVAMFISFIAGHYFVLTDKYNKNGILFYLYIAICLPITYYGAVQLPLYIDLVKVIWKKVPPPSIKGVKL